MIEVRTCARLHLGLLDNNGEHGRLYGSIGLAVNRPQLLLRAEKSDSLIVEGLEIDRVEAYAQRFIRRYNLHPGAYLNLAAGIPAHVGLGSGTQIALAVGTALARLSNLNLSTEEIALATGRGARSGIGIAAFRHGGFVLDGGHRVLADTKKVDNSCVPPILFHHSVPRDWSFVTAIPGKKQGFSGETERSAFQHMPEARPNLVEKISRLLLMKMLPALIEEDIIAFGQALTEIQMNVGECFASVQGGRFSNPLSGKLIDFMLDKGAAGAGQSSWGPAVYGLVQGKEKARQLVKETRCFLEDIGGGQVFCVETRNRGASVKNIGRPALVANL